VATPIDWEELSNTGPSDYTIENIFRRIGQKEDPWKYLFQSGRPITPIKRKIESLDEWD